MGKVTVREAGVDGVTSELIGPRGDESSGLIEHEIHALRLLNGGRIDGDFIYPEADRCVGVTLDLPIQTHASSFYQGRTLAAGAVTHF